MRRYQEIFAIAADRHGGDAALEALLHRPLPAEALAAIPDDRWLSGFTRVVFQAGFSWKVIDAKWDGFEAAFHGFDIPWCSGIEEERLDALLADKRIIRNGAKVASVQTNALFFQDLAAQHGSAAACFARWPDADFAGLLEMMKKRGGRLGGLAAQRALRQMGRDGWALSGDVAARLHEEGVLDGPATSKKALRAVQEAFDIWRAQSGRSMTEISRTLALSIDG